MAIFAAAVVVVVVDVDRRCFLLTLYAQLPYFNFSLSQTSLEQIFNGFASKQEEELGGAAGIVSEKRNSATISTMSTNPLAKKH